MTRWILNVKNMPWHGHFWICFENEADKREIQGHFFLRYAECLSSSFSPYIIVVELSVQPERSSDFGKSFARVDLKDPDLKVGPSILSP